MSTEPKPSEPPDMWAGSGDGDSVAAVSPEDLRSVWKLIQETKAQHPGGCVSIGNTVYQSVCSPGADVMAVWYRASMLSMFQIIPEFPLNKWTHDGEFDDAVFQVAATFPMENILAGVTREGLPFDLEEFVKRIGART